MKKFKHRMDPKTSYKNLDDIVDVTVNLYLNRIESYRKRFQFIPIVFGVVPTLNNSNPGLPKG